MNKQDKIYIAGHRGMVGSALWRALEGAGYKNLIGHSSQELDLKNQNLVHSFFEKEKPAFVFLAAARVGGIIANNTYRAEFLYDNLMIQSNVIHSAYQAGVKKLLFLGSSCIYPKHSPQPMKEEALLTGKLESTNEPYAIAKIAGIKMCESYRQQYGCNFISAMPTNLYGTNDNYHPQNSHVIPALIRKFVDASLKNSSKVEIWGTGKPLREFMHVDDLASACVYLMNNYNQSDFINIGTEKEISIEDLAKMIKKIVGFSGEIYFNSEHPDGTPRKLMDSSRLHKLGWSGTIDLKEGLKKTIDEYRSTLQTN